MVGSAQILDSATAGPLGSSSGAIQRNCLPGKMISNSSAASNAADSQAYLAAYTDSYPNQPQQQNPKETNQV